MINKKQKSKLIHNDCPVSFIVLVLRVPSQTILIEFDNHLRAFCIGLFRRHQFSFVSAFPLHQEHKLAGVIWGAQNFLRHKAASKSILFVGGVGVFFAVIRLFRITLGRRWFGRGIFDVLLFDGFLDCFAATGAEFGCFWCGRCS